MKTPVIDLSLDTIAKKKQALIFTNTKRGAEKTAEDISKKIKETTEEKLAKKILTDLAHPTKQCSRLALCVKKGIAFHHSGLTSNQRTLIEDGFREGKIKIIASTPTLAAGLDLPAYRTILKDLKRFGQRGMQFIPVLEYLQMAGRAGRPKYDTIGEAICIASTQAEKEDIIERYIHGEPEEIYSKLAVEPVLRTYLLSLISTRFVRSRKQILSFFSKTFWAHQFKDMPKLEYIIDKMLDLLIHWEFIKGEDFKTSNEFTTANQFTTTDKIKDKKYNATLLGKRVAELYLDPYTAHGIIKGLRLATGKETTSFSYLQLISQTLEMRPQLSVRTKEYEKIQNEIVHREEELITKEPNIYEHEFDTFLKSIKTAIALESWINEMPEENILEEYNLRPGELKVKLETCNWLLYGASELARIQEFKGLLSEISKLRFRLKYGAKEELLPLLRFKGIGRVKARKLYRNNIKNLRGIKETPLATLGQIIGPLTAKTLKNQIDQKITKGTSISSFESPP